MIDQLVEFLKGKPRALLFDWDGKLKPVCARPNMLVFPGSFNPLHIGHERMFHLAEQITKQPAYLEISVQNVDKRSLQARELINRLEQLKGKFRVLLTHAPRFLEKAAIFPKSTFLMGYDTACRLLDPTYCVPVPLEEQLSQFNKLGIRFLIAGRLDGEKFLTLKSLSIPTGFEHLFSEICEKKFREDVSSSEIRKSQT